mgnify:CR=1 FL=1
MEFDRDTKKLTIQTNSALTFLTPLSRNATKFISVSNQVGGHIFPPGGSHNFLS